MHETTVPEGRWERLNYWLENVFWYHYKWYYFAGVFVAVLLITSLVSWIGKVDYDWTVQYVHAGAADEAASAELQRRFQTAATDESGNGKVQVQINEFAETTDPGRMDLLGLLRDGDRILYVLDETTLAACRELGYFETVTPLGNGLYAAVWDTPITPYTMADFEGYGYTQDQIDESNAYREGKHLELVEAARVILDNL